jgi:GTPase SAR1 family protein
MGIGRSSARKKKVNHLSGSADEIKQNESVQEDIFRSQLSNLYQFKVLVLGAGESGKSTVIKQLRFIHKNNKLSESELKRIKQTLVENVMDCLKALVDAAQSLEIEFKDQEIVEIAKKVADEQYSRSVIEESASVELSKLWQSKEIQQVYSHKDKFWILDSAEYFMENIGRFANPSFEPTEEDVIMSRIKTTGIVTTEFDQRNPDGKEEWSKNIHYKVIDVGGQRSERKKWMNCFDDVKAIVFVVNLAGYNMVLYEEESKNRLHECLEIFEETVNQPIFCRTPIFLFMNKKDLFEEKIRQYDMNMCFPEYTGGKNLNAAMEFVAQKFRDKVPQGNRDQFQEFFIASRLKQDVKYAFEDLQADLLRMNKKSIEVEEKRIVQNLKNLKK